MKLRLTILLLFTTCLAYKAQANSAAAGSVSYTWLSDSTYRVLFRLYADCAGSAAPATMQLCAHNLCNNTTLNRTMHQWNGNLQNGLPNGSEVALGCSPHGATICTDPQAKYPGWREWWYVDTLTLPTRCNNWVFRVTDIARNNNRNLQPANMYVEATLDNQLYPQNASPVLPQSMIFVCDNQIYTGSIAAIDADGDSLVYQLVQPLTGSACNASQNTTFKQVNPPLNTNNNPFQTYNQFSLSANGKLTFTATDTGRQIFTVKVNEYRNGIYIGGSVHDVHVYAFNCGYVGPPAQHSRVYFVDTITGADTAFFNSYVKGIVGQKMIIDFYFKSPDTTSQYLLRSDISTTIPSAILTFSNQQTDSVRGRLSWVPFTGDFGQHTYHISVRDTACRPPGIFPLYNASFDISISWGVSISNNAELRSFANLYPNPSNGAFTITLNDASVIYPVTLEVINTLGQKMHELSITTQTTPVNMSTLPKGMYLLRAAGNNTGNAVRFVIQ